MGLLSHVLNSIASGFAPRRPNPAAVAAETCCEQLGWSVNERPNAKEMRLRFNDPLIRYRYVEIGFADDGVYLALRVFSAVWMPARMVPHAALGYLLERNGKLLVSWEVCIRQPDNGIVGFAVSYFALAAGLRAEVFKSICQTMIQEAYEFDSRMYQAGLLR
jgi:hypothetical protein